MVKNVVALSQELSISSSDRVKFFCKILEFSIFCKRILIGSFGSSFQPEIFTEYFSVFILEKVAKENLFRFPDLFGMGCHNSFLKLSGNRKIFGTGSGNQKIYRFSFTMLEILNSITSFQPYKLFKMTITYQIHSEFEHSLCNSYQIKFINTLSVLDEGNDP